MFWWVLKAYSSWCVLSCVPICITSAMHWFPTGKRWKIENSRPFPSQECTYDCMRLVFLAHTDKSFIPCCVWHQSWIHIAKLRGGCWVSAAVSDWEWVTKRLQPFFCLFPSYITKYNHNRWLRVKHQVTYLLTLLEVTLCGMCCLQVCTRRTWWPSCICWWL